MIKLEHITLGYDGRELVADATADIRGSRLTALLGRNGSGKSTLLRAIAGLEAPAGGRILVGGRDIAAMSAMERARQISLVTTERIRIANMRCRDVVALGRAPYTDWIGRLSPRDNEIVDRALSLAGMTDYASHTLDTMSDGECQRVMIARAIAQDTPVILLDEPTSFLDIPNRHSLVRLLASLAHDGGKTVLFSTHELDIAMAMTDSVALIADGTLAVIDTADAAAAISAAFSI